MLELLSEQRCFGGRQLLFRHTSSAIGLTMRFAAFVPEQASQRALPALIYLAGLTCNEETFMIKAGAQRLAAELGMILIAPDTSPREAGIAGEADDWEVGMAASFYLDATEAPWAQHYRMQSYLLELRELVLAQWQIAGKPGIMGHSMGGHGALVTALRQPELFASVSAIAPIAHPVACAWGEKAFTTLLGPRSAAWEAYDASLLMQRLHTPFRAGILIDQGMADKFLPTQLHPDAFEKACLLAGQPLQLRRHPGYDHGYYFIASVIDSHLRFHYQAGLHQA